MNERAVVAGGAIPADSVIRVSPSSKSGMVPSGLMPRYSFAKTRGGNGSIFSS